MTQKSYNYVGYSRKKIHTPKQYEYTNMTSAKLNP